jgi:ABC-type transport system substrate-binding protein
VARPALIARLALGLLVTIGAVSCTSDSTPSPAPSTSTSSPSSTLAEGGSVRVAVWDEPDPTAPTLGGAGVRALVLPQLFVAQPGGRWTPSLVAPRSDREAPDKQSVSFRLREKATWSDGTPITVEDLRRSADAELVAGVDGPAADGTVTVRFTQPFPGWRRLWSGLDSLSPPRPDVWGGPFVVAGRTAGLETVLRRNDRWYGDGGPYLDEVRLVLVPDAATARELLKRGELDVVMPPPATARTAQLQAIDGVEVATADESGWWTGLRVQPERLSPGRRQAVAATVDRRTFVSTLLQGEAELLEGGPEPAGSAAGLGTVDLVGMHEEPMTMLLQRSIQKRARGHGKLELRNAEVDRVQGWLAEGSYDAAVAPAFDPPGACRPCSEADVAQAVLLPLWRWRVVVAWQERVEGVVANGYALNAAWNAASWHLR